VNLVKKIVMRPVAALVPYASNSRTHTPDQISLIARSIEAFGFTNPILVDGENGIVAGHARLKAAQKIGLAEVPTIELSWLTPAEKQAYIIADNQTAISGSGWDAEMLRLELGDLKELGFDLSLTGFDDIQLGSFMRTNRTSRPVQRAISRGLTRRKRPHARTAAMSSPRPELRLDWCTYEAAKYAVEH
jgi:ParB-like chromosome segregation protein Spo0J